MRYLLDTRVVSDFARGVPAVLAHLKSVNKGDVAICTVSTAVSSSGFMG